MTREKILEEMFGLILVAAYCLLIAFIYIHQIQPDFAYLGLQINVHFEDKDVALILITITTVFLFRPREVYLPSSMLSLLIFYFVYIPALLISYVSGVVVGYDVLYLGLSMTISMMILFIIPRTFNIKFSGFQLNKKTFNFLSIIIIVSAVLVVVYFYRLNFSTIRSIANIGDLYNLRGGFRDISTGVPSVVSYLFAWSSKVIAPFMIVFGIINKKSPVLIAGIAFTVYIFLITGLKSVILAPIVILFLIKLLRSHKLNFVLVAFFLCSLLVISTISQVFGFPELNNILVRRVIIFPGLLTSYYFEYFSMEGYTYLGESVLAMFFDYHYDVSPPFLIGSYYFGRTEMSANANYLASAFGNFGAFGMIVYSLVLSLVFGFVDKIALYKQGAPEATALLALPIWALVDSALLTTFVTHGLLFAICILIVVPKELFISGNRAKDETRNRVNHR